MDFSRMSDGIRLHHASHRHDGYDGDDEAGPAPSAPFLTTRLAVAPWSMVPAWLQVNLQILERTPRARTPSTMTPTRFNPNIPRRWATRAATSAITLRRARMFRPPRPLPAHHIPGWALLRSRASLHGRKTRKIGYFYGSIIHASLLIYQPDQHLGELRIRLGRPWPTSPTI